MSASILGKVNLDDNGDAIDDLETILRPAMKKIDEVTGWTRVVGGKDSNAITSLVKTVTERQPKFDPTHVAEELAVSGSATARGVDVLADQFSKMFLALFSKTSDKMIAPVALAADKDEEIQQV